MCDFPGRLLSKQTGFNQVLVNSSAGMKIDGFPDGYLVISRGEIVWPEVAHDEEVRSFLDPYVGMLDRRSPGLIREVAGEA
jgi:hypothetical protein